MDTDAMTMTAKIERASRAMGMDMSADEVRKAEEMFCGYSLAELERRLSNRRKTFEKNGSTDQDLADEINAMYIALAARGCSPVTNAFENAFEICRNCGEALTWDPGAMRWRHDALGMREDRPCDPRGSFLDAPDHVWEIDPAAINAGEGSEREALIQIMTPGDPNYLDDKGLAIVLRSVGGLLERKAGTLPQCVHTALIWYFG